MIKLSVTLDEINYAEILEKLAASEKLEENSELSFVLAGILKFGRQSIERMPEATKEHLAVKMLNQNKDRLCQNAETLLKQNGISARIADCSIERTTE